MYYMKKNYMSQEKELSITKPASQTSYEAPLGNSRLLFS